MFRTILTWFLLGGLVVCAAIVKASEVPRLPGAPECWRKGTRHRHTFGASAPLKELQKKFGFEPERVVAVARELLQEQRLPAQTQ